MLRKIKSLYNLLKSDGIKRVVVEIIQRFHLPIQLPQKLLWEAGIKSQVRFWDMWFETKGLRWPEEYKKRFDPNLLLQSKVCDLLPNQNQFTILDVGAGPLTILGKKCDGKSVIIKAIDPLADEYDILLKKYKIDPLIRTEKLDAEKLDNKYLSGTFDLVYAKNSIDHSYDPEHAILQMIKVVKSGCFVLLEHANNEAENQNYLGFHQWNFSMSDEENFLISNKNSFVNMTEKYDDICDIVCEINKNMLITRIRKK